MKLKPALSVLLAALLLLSAGLFACAEEKQTQYLVLGDSIGYGAGVANPQTGAFGKIVADSNGFAYTNDAVNGHTSADLLARLNDAKVIAHVQKADIISVSIGGNDFLRNNMSELLLQAGRGETAQFDAIRDKLAVNFAQIVARLRALQPNAVIIAQTLYNPAPTESMRALYQYAIDRVNEVVTSVPGILVADVAAAFRGRTDLISFDNIHPNAEGNVVIARTVLQVMAQNGLGSATEPVIASPGRNWGEPAGTHIFASIREFFNRILNFFRKLFSH